MAIGWLSVLKMVPWSDVISNAPKVADGAKKLWSTVAKKPSAAAVASQSEQPALSPEAQLIAKLQAQLAAAEAGVSDLRNQMIDSSALIKALADQNTQLIKRVEVNRIRVLWLAGAVVVLGVVVAINMATTIAR
jgi:capsule polysaccharide export protein KpsE/RkpR